MVANRKTKHSNVTIKVSFITIIIANARQQSQWYNQNLCAPSQMECSIHYEECNADSYAYIKHLLPLLISISYLIFPKTRLVISEII